VEILSTVVLSVCTPHSSSHLRGKNRTGRPWFFLISAWRDKLNAEVAIAVLPVGEPAGPHRDTPLLHCMKVEGWFVVIVVIHETLPTEK